MADSTAGKVDDGVTVCGSFERFVTICHEDYAADETNSE
jgi:hypothetical protein